MLTDLGLYPHWEKARPESPRKN
ncbi:hypothetical protein ED21_18992 [Erythrobacter sp. SD-21]|nr:hypothetical protein ED21_18992 [Erythrobacter sp. SD-21]